MNAAIQWNGTISFLTKTLQTGKRFHDMKNHRYTRIPHLVALSALTVLLAACGNSAPSESDAKTAFQSQIDHCQDVTLTSFKKTNGIPGNVPNTYQVEIEYTLKLEPTSDERTE